MSTAVAGGNNVRREFFELKNQKVLTDGTGFDDKDNEEIFSMICRLHSKLQFEGTDFGLWGYKKVDKHLE
ncbi:MAG: hypothetical protein JWR72_868 [Flavisolibacter sp.]|nr:hypothetical protein [Flavisolibacter sp.]